MNLEARLAELLQSMFDPDELYTFLGHHIRGGRGVIDDLPKPPALGRAQYAARVAEKVLERRMLDEVFIDAWVETRRGHEEDIRSLLELQVDTRLAPTPVPNPSPVPSHETTSELGPGS